MAEGHETRKARSAYGFLLRLCAKHMVLMANNKGSTKVLMFPFATPCFDGAYKANNEGNN